MIMINLGHAAENDGLQVEFEPDSKGTRLRPMIPSPPGSDMLLQLETLTLRQAKPVPEQVFQGVYTTTSPPTNISSMLVQTEGPSNNPTALWFPKSRWCYVEGSGVARKMVFLKTHS